MANLALVRHGLSAYNKQGLWTGLRDPDLSEEGLDDAKNVAVALNGIKFDYAFSSPLKRHVHTLEIILEDLGQSNIPAQKDAALNERDYGIYTGKNKWDVKSEMGEEEFKKLRRSWDYPVPEGESLKDVYARVTNFYDNNILPLLREDKNVIISSSGNVLRALVKHLDQISDEDITRLEIAPGEVYLYKFENGKVQSKEIRNKKENIY